MNNKKSKKNKITKKTKNNSKVVNMKSNINSKNLIQFKKLRVTLIVCILIFLLLIIRIGFLQFVQGN